MLTNDNTVLTRSAICSQLVGNAYGHDWDAGQTLSSEALVLYNALMYPSARDTAPAKYLTPDYVYIGSSVRVAYVQVLAVIAHNMAAAKARVPTCHYAMGSDVTIKDDHHWTARTPWKLVGFYLTSETRRPMCILEEIGGEGRTPHLPQSEVDGELAEDAASNAQYRQERAERKANIEATNLAMARLPLHLPQSEVDGELIEETWTANEQRTAMSEGWHLFETADGLRIQRDDISPSFANDVQALSFVTDLAVRGSALHRKALAIHTRG